MTRRRLYNTLLTLLTLIAAIALMRMIWDIAAPFTDLLILLGTAWLIAFILRPLAVSMSEGKLAHQLVDAVRRRWGNARANALERALYPVAVTLIYLSLLAILIISLIAIIPSTIREARQLVIQLGDYARQFPDWWLSQQQAIARRFNIAPEAVTQFYRPEDINRQLASMVDMLPPLIGGLIRGIASGVGETLLALALSYYLMLDGPRLARQVYDLLPRRFYDEYELVGATIARAFGGFLRGQLVMVLLSGIVTSIAATFAGLHFGLIIGAIAGLVIFIPVIGAPIAMFLPSVIALIQGAPPLTALVLLAVLTAFQQVLLHFLVPRIMSESVGMPPVLAILAVLIATRLWGVAGFVFGIPVAGAIYTTGIVLLGRLKREQDRLDAESGTSD
jgi:predicted PurR-regulated permease PerM